MPRVHDYQIISYKVQVFMCLALFEALKFRKKAFLTWKY